MEMKTQTLVAKLEAKLYKRGHKISVGEIALAIKILELAKEQAPDYNKIKLMIP